MKARTLSRTLRLVSSSTEVMTSTAKGRTAATARPTLPGWRPPARMHGATPVSTTVRARPQSTALPVPAGRPGTTESTRTASAPAVDEAAGGGGQELGRRPGDGGVDAQRLDEADAGAGQAGGQLGDAGLGLVAVELEGVGLGGVDQLEDRGGVAADDGHPGDERRHRPHELGRPAAGEDPGVGVGVLDDEAEGVGAFLDGHGGVVFVGDPADLDPDGHPALASPASRCRSGPGSPRPGRGPGGWTCRRGRRRRRRPGPGGRRRGPEMALSESSTLPGGRLGTSRSVRLTSPSSVSPIWMSRLFTPSTSGRRPRSTTRAIVLVVVDLDEGLEPPLVGGGVEAGQRLVVEEADGEEDGVGPGVDRLVEVALARR